MKSADSIDSITLSKDKKWCVDNLESILHRKLDKNELETIESGFNQKTEIENKPHEVDVRREVPRLIPSSELTLEKRKHREPMDLVIESVAGEGSAKLFRLFNEGKYEEALKINEELDGNEKPPHYWYNKGSALRNLSKFEEAVECYDKAIKADPKYAKAHYWKGISQVSISFTKIKPLEKVDVVLSANDSFENVLELAADSKNTDQKDPAKQLYMVSQYNSFLCLGFAVNTLTSVHRKGGHVNNQFYDKVHIQFLQRFDMVYRRFRRPLKRFDNGGIIYNDGPKEFIIYNKGPIISTPEDLEKIGHENLTNLVGQFFDFCRENKDSIVEQIMPNIAGGFRTTDGHYAATIRSPKK